MSFTSIPVIANDKTKPEYIFSSIEMFLFFYVETTTKRKQNNSVFQSYHFIKMYVGNVYYRP